MMSLTQFKRESEIEKKKWFKGLEVLKQRIARSIIT